MNLMPACRNMSCLKVPAMKFPRLQRSPPKEGYPDAWWQCLVCGHIFDHDLHDLTAVKFSEILKCWTKYLKEKREWTNTEISEVTGVDKRTISNFFRYEAWKYK